MQDIKIIESIIRGMTSPDRLDAFSKQYQKMFEDSQQLISEAKQNPELLSLAWDYVGQSVKPREDRSFDSNIESHRAKYLPMAQLALICLVQGILIGKSISRWEM